MPYKSSNDCIQDIYVLELNNTTNITPQSILFSNIFSIFNSKLCLQGKHSRVSRVFQPFFFIASWKIHVRPLSSSVFLKATSKLSLKLSVFKWQQSYKSSTHRKISYWQEKIPLLRRSGSQNYITGFGLHNFSDTSDCATW